MIPVAIQAQVAARSGGRCEWWATPEQRCPFRGYLRYHHRQYPRQLQSDDVAHLCARHHFLADLQRKSNLAFAGRLPWDGPIEWYGRILAEKFSSYPEHRQAFVEAVLFERALLEQAMEDSEWVDEALAEPVYFEPNAVVAAARKSKELLDALAVLHWRYYMQWLPGEANKYTSDMDLQSGLLLRAARLAS